MKRSFTLLGILFPFLLNAQQDLSEQEVDSLLQIRDEVQGTYQVQMINTRNKPAIPISLYGKIQLLRKEEEVVFYKLSPKVRVKILPRKTINSSGFEGIKRIGHVLQDNS